MTAWRRTPHQGKSDFGSNLTEVERITGETRDYTLDRLERDAPDLYDAVLRDELSANAAAIQAGFRPKSFTVRVTTPESIAATLCRQLDPNMLCAVVKLIR